MDNKATTRDVRSRRMRSHDPRFWKLPYQHRAPKTHYDYLHYTIVLRASARSNGESLPHERRNHARAGEFPAWLRCNAGCKRPSRPPAGPGPKHATTEQVLQSQPTGLRLLQLEEWEDGHLYNENPPSSIHYAVEWKVTHSEKNKKNKKVVSKDTEQDVVLTPVAY
jgi:hypothetical protein